MIAKSNRKIDDSVKFILNEKNTNYVTKNRLFTYRLLNLTVFRKVEPLKPNYYIQTSAFGSVIVFEVCAFRQKLGNDAYNW